MGTSTSIPLREGTAEEPNLPEDEHPDAPAADPLTTEYEKLKKEIQLTLKQKKEMTEDDEESLQKKQKIHRKLEALEQLKTLFEQYYSEEKEPEKQKLFEELKKGKKDLLLLINASESDTGETLISPTSNTEGHSSEAEKRDQAPREAKKDISSPSQKTKPDPQKAAATGQTTEATTKKTPPKGNPELSSESSFPAKRENDASAEKKTPPTTSQPKTESPETSGLNPEKQGQETTPFLKTSSNTIQPTTSNSTLKTSSNSVKRLPSGEKSLKEELLSSESSKEGKESEEDSPPSFPQHGQKIITSNPQLYNLNRQREAQFTKRQFGLKPPLRNEKPQNFGFFYWRSPLRNYF